MSNDSAEDLRRLKALRKRGQLIVHDREHDMHCIMGPAEYEQRKHEVDIVVSADTPTQGEAKGQPAKQQAPAPKADATPAATEPLPPPPPAPVGVKPIHEVIADLNALTVVRDVEAYSSKDGRANVADLARGRIAAIQGDEAAASPAQPPANTPAGGTEGGATGSTEAAPPPPPPAPKAAATSAPKKKAAAKTAPPTNTNTGGNA